MVAPFVNIHEAETGGSLCSLGHSGLHIKFHNSRGYIVEKLSLRQKYLAIVFLGDSVLTCSERIDAFMQLYKLV